MPLFQMHVHIKQPEDPNSDAQPAKKHRKKKNKALLSTPTMVPFGNDQDKKTLSEASSDEDMVVMGERKDLAAEVVSSDHHNLMESLSHYERILASGLSVKKVQDANISSSNQTSPQVKVMDPGPAGLGLQGLMGLPAIDASLMSGQSPEVLARAAAVAVSNQLLQSREEGREGGGGVQALPQPAHLQLVDSHLRHADPVSTHDQFYTSSSSLEVLAPHTRFMVAPGSQADLPLTYVSATTSASSFAATTSHLTLPTTLHSSSRAPSALPSPHSEGLNFNP